MAAVAMEIAKMLQKIEKQKNDHRRLLTLWIFLQSLTKFDEKNKKKILIPPFSFPWQLRQNLSNRFRFFWLISLFSKWVPFQNGHQYKN
jgi:hypothetical protein